VGGASAVLEGHADWADRDWDITQLFFSLCVAGGGLTFQSRPTARSPACRPKDLHAGADLAGGPGGRHDPEAPRPDETRRCRTAFGARTAATATERHPKNAKREGTAACSSTSRANSKPL
jgi:hypothetical protein